MTQEELQWLDGKSYIGAILGELAERLKAPDSKSGGPKGLGGSNPSLSANSSDELPDLRLVAERFQLDALAGIVAVVALALHARAARGALALEQLALRSVAVRDAVLALFADGAGAADRLFHASAVLADETVPAAAHLRGGDAARAHFAGRRAGSGGRAGLGERKALAQVAVDAGVLDRFGAARGAGSAGG